MANFFAARTLPILWVGTLLGFAYTTFDWVERIGIALDQPTADDRWYEVSALLFTLPMVLPAVLGFYLLIRRRLPHDAPTGLYYLIYAVLLVLALVLRYTTNDPLAYGLPMLLIFLPACAVLTLLIGLRLTRKEEAGR